MPRGLIAFGFLLSFALPASAQIAPPQSRLIEVDTFSRLEDQLINRLRATTEGQREYLRRVVKQARQGRLETKLIVAIERYAIRRNASFPFPFFERAIRYEADKRGVALTPSQQLAAPARPFSYVR